MAVSTSTLTFSSVPFDNPPNPCETLNHAKTQKQTRRLQTLTMPFKSQAQRAFMHIHHPRLAARWEREYPVKQKLPAHKGTKVHSNPGIQMPVRQRVRFL